MKNMYQGFMGNGTSEEQVMEAIQESAVLVDVRSLEDFNEGSIPNAIHIPVAKFASNNHSLKSDQTIIVFCNTGNKAAQVKHLLEQKGFRRVINGGMMEELMEVVKEVRN